MKTVVDQIAEYLKSFGIILNEKTIAEFKEKHKQQIIEAYEKDMDSNGNLSFESGEQYYNETFS